ncbi:MAG: DUF748 domain-containing protein [Propionivibrio sp.]
MIAVLGALSIAGFVAYRLAVRAIEDSVMKALGPRGEVQALHLGLTGLEIQGLRIRAPSPQTRETAWPAEDELRATRILAMPSFLDLMRLRLVFDSIRIEGAYLSVLRTKDGKVQVLPSRLSPDPAAAGAGSGTPSPTVSKPPAAPLTIASIEVIDGAIDFFDATLRKLPVKQQFDRINARIGSIRIPELTGQSTIRLEAMHKGIHQDGRISIDGSIELATRESGITTTLRGVDLVSFQPYLVKANETGVSKGRLDFELNSSVKKGMLYAPGSLVLSDLELAPSSTSIMGIPLKLAVKMLKSRKGKISANFVLTGDINDPSFSLNENLLTRVAAAIAGKLGVDLEGLVKSVEGIGSGTVTGVVKSLGIPKQK